MKLKYEGDEKLKLIYPFKMDIYKGVEFETDDKDTIKRLKEIGFKQAKEKTEEEGDK